MKWESALPTVEATGTTTVSGFPKTTAVDNKGNLLRPLRPLTAYNFYFRDERDRILQHGPEYEQSVVLDEKRRQKLLNDHWGRDRSKKRLHRKSHGKISFAALSKLISSRWNALSKADQNYYRDVAAVDLARFKEETDALE